METKLIETLASHVDRYTKALDEIPLLEMDGWSEEARQEHEESVARLADDPEIIVFDEGVVLAGVAGAVVEWLKLPEQEATRERLGQMVEEALTEDEE
jgi:hypothetical protein